MPEIIRLFLIAMTGAFLQTNLGFGLPVIAMLFLPMFLPFSTSVAMYQIIGLLSTAYLTLHYRKHIDWKMMLPLLLVSLAVGAVVTFSSMRMAKGSLIIMLGAALVSISVFSVWFSDRISIRATRKSGAAMGFVAGLGNGLFGIGGPPVAIYFMAAAGEKRVYMATLQCYFLISNLSTIAIRTGGGAVSSAHIPLIVSGWFGIAAGTFFGIRLFERLPKALLKRLVYGFVGVSGIWMIIQELLL